MDGDVKPAMGYIYEAMELAKEQIKSNFNGVKSRYKPIWEKIDQRWNLQIHRPLYAVGYYLNPSLHFERNFKADQYIKRALFDCIEKLYDRPTVIKIHEQLAKFHDSIGMFGSVGCMEMRKRMQPAKWWETYGDECPELQQLAIRVLSLTCSATDCVRNWSTFDHIHSKKRNRLEQQWLNALVFVKYNINLETRLQKRKERGETYDPICLSDMESDDEWITEKENVCLPKDISWMHVQEFFQEDEETSSKKRKRGPRNLNKVSVDKNIGKNKIVDVHDEDEDGLDEDGLHETTVILDEDDKYFDSDP
uniref:uncharacterized protein LOC122595077 n=1 Tax=Erigeron canadensis TaxID=72917 RepID=UPI001CB9032E|nr:uncharacterized protein LOC122595077 [Erigeron canadensis]